jgi:glycosyltransferase involved in cell wall biosynthesis
MSDATHAPLQVAVDAHNLLSSGGGIARYVREILVRFGRRGDISLTLLMHGAFLRPAEARLACMLPGVAFRIARRVPADVNVTWHPWNGTFFESRKPSVVTMHDTVPFDFPAATVRKRESQQQPFLRSARTAARILTVSEFAATRIVETLGVARSLVRVTPLAAGEAFRRVTGSRWTSTEQPNLYGRLRGRPYVLCLSSMEPVKNFALLYDAWKRAFPQQELALVATGVDASRYADAIVLAQIDDPNRLAALYARALFVAVASLSESFGLPVIEAMSVGIPVVANRVGGLPEVGGDAVYYVECARDADEWCRSLQLLSDDGALRERLRARGLQRAQHFSWDRTAHGTIETLRSACASGEAG